MKPLTINQKLKIANSGGSFKEENSGWVGTIIRKGKMLGKVVMDMNGAYRDLTVKFDDGHTEVISMSNTGPDSESVHQYEWQRNYDGQKKWYRF